MIHAHRQPSSTYRGGPARCTKRMKEGNPNVNALTQSQVNSQTHAERHIDYLLIYKRADCA